MQEYSASNIITMSDLTHLRAFPQMYMGCSPDSPKIQVQLAKEIVDNSKDEAANTPHLPQVINILVFSKGDRYQFCVCDRGRGVPIEKLAVSFSKLKTSGKYNAEAYGTTTGVYGVGSKATNALSETFVAISKRDGKVGIAKFCKGELVREEVQARVKSSSSGCIIFYELDKTIVKCIPDFVTQGLLEIIDLVEFFATFQSQIKYKILLADKLISQETLKSSPLELWDLFTNYTDGKLLFSSESTISQLDYVVKKCKLPSTNLMEFDEIIRPTSDGIGYDIKLFLTSDFASASNVGLVAAVNMVRLNAQTDSHVNGVMRVIKSFLLQNLVDTHPDDDDIKMFFLSGYKLPLSGFIITDYIDAVFGGQTKDSFEDTAFLNRYEAFLNIEFTRISKERPDLFGTLYELIQEDIENKYNRMYNKSLNKVNGLKNITFSLNNVGAYVGCRSTDNTLIEMFITEGSSAGDSVRKLRNSNFQAVLKLRGKPLNALRADPKTLRNNLINQDLVSLIGVSPYDKDLSKMNFNKIGILTDADQHGYHIAALLIGMLYKINPLILEQGRVFVSNPPLYVMSTGAASLFLRDYSTLMDVKIEHVYSKLEISIVHRLTNKILRRYNNRQDLLNPKFDVATHTREFRDFCYWIDRVGNILTIEASKLVIDPTILEMLVYCVDYLNPIQPDKIAKLLNLDNVIVHPVTKTLILIQGDVELSIPMTNLEKIIREVILPELTPMAWHYTEYRVTAPDTKYYNNEPLTVSQIYNLFTSLDKNFSISRFKGLGEMGNCLAYTCLDPATRCTTTVKGIGDVDTIYRMLGVCADDRKELI